MGQLPYNVLLDEPSAPAKGALWYDNNVGKIMVYDGYNWLAVLDGDEMMLHNWKWVAEGPNEWVVKIFNNDWYLDNSFDFFQLVERVFIDQGARHIVLKDAESATFFKLKYS